MRHIDDWSAIQEKQDGEYDRPAPGGYAARICGVTDNEQKEYLEIRWDFAQAPYIGVNNETYVRAGFWPTRLFRSYKEKALPFFKAFKTAVEESNPGYLFDDRAVKALEGKKIGVVLGEEEYTKKDGSVGTRLYVDQVRSLQAISKGDFKIPDLKHLPGAPRPAGRPVDVYPDSSWAPIAEDNDDLPF